MIRERVCRIVATRDEAPVAAAVRFDTSTDKLGGMLLHDAPLPRLEHHWSQMLPARAVLRKQHWPGVRIRVDDRDDAPPADPDRAAGPQHRDGFRDSADDRFLVPTPRPARGWPSADGRGGRIRTCKSSRTEDFKSSVFASFTTPPSSDRKSTRLNSSHLVISYAVFCLKKQKAQLESPSKLLSPAVLKRQRTRTQARRACILIESASHLSTVNL